MHKLVRLTIATVLVFSLSIYAKADCWKRQYPGFPTETLRSMVFTSPSDGIVVGDGGMIARTADSGTNWTLLNYITTEQLRSVAFPTALKGWAGGAKGTLLQSADGGYTWGKSTTFPDSINISSVSFRSADTGYVAGDSCIWATYNGGLSWSRYKAAVNFQYVKAFANDTVYAYARFGPMMRSYDNGQTWSLVTTTSYYQMDFANPRIGWAVQHPGSGSNDYYYKTTNGGTTWTLQNTVFNSYPTAGNMQVLDTNNVFILNSGNGSGVHGVYYSNNGGASWTYSSSLSLLYSTCLYFTSSTTGMLGNMYGMIYSTKAPGAFTPRTNAGIPIGSNHMETIDFGDALHGIAAGGTRTFRTVNGGATWASGGSLVNNSFAVSLQMVDSLRAWLVGDDGSLFKTINGGVSWANTSYYCNDARFYSANFGMAGTTSDVRITRNAGASWTSALGSIGTGFGAITCSDSLHWFVQGTGTAKSLYKSTDAGATWSAVSTYNNSFIDLTAFDTSKLYSGHATNVGKSTDGGVTFTDMYPNNFATGAILYNAKISFYDTLHGMATATGGLLIAKTGNGALSWQRMTLNSMSSYTSVAYEDSSHAWLCTNFGSIYRYYATCPPDAAYIPMLNRTAHLGCAGSLFSVAIANRGTYTNADTLSAVLRQGTTVIGSLSISASGQISFNLPTSAGSYTLEVKLVNAVNPQGIIRSIPIAVQSAVTPTISVAASASTVCSGVSVNYTSAITNGGTATAYQWKVNNVNAGANASTFSNTPANGDVVSCELTSNTPCATTSTATSNSITMVVNPIITPSATIAANPAGAVCSGTSVSYTIITTNGGTAPTYQWKVNNVNVGTGGSSYTYTPANNDSIVCILTPNITCPSAVTTSSNKIFMTVTPTVIPANSITASATSVCAGTSVTFTATPANVGTTPAFQWKLNSVNAGTNSPTFTYTPGNGDQMTCTATTTSGGCYSAASITSNTITVNVTSPATPTISIAGSANTVCSGTSVSYTSAITNGGTSPAYQWKVNNVAAGTNTSTFGYIPANGDVVTCVLSSNAICATTATTTSNSITMVVNAIVTPSATIAANPGGSICSGTSVTYTVSPTNGGTAPFYQWKVNNVNVGSGGSSYTYAPANNDSIVCVLSSSVTCLSTATTPSNEITMTVTPTVIPSIATTSSATLVCAGTSVAFSASPSNGGTAPVYQWMVNGINAGTDSSGYSYVPANGDTVRCILTSNASCPTVSSVSSTGIIIIVSPLVTPSVQVSVLPDTSICTGTAANFTAAITGGGSAPSYQWKLNSTNTSTNAATYSNATLANGDVIACVLTSNASCATTSTATSAQVSMTVYPAPAPVITRNGNTLSPGAGGVSYTWYLNGNPIAAANGSTYIPTQNGSYTVNVIDANGCAGTSGPFNADYVGVSGEPLLGEITYYPNPARTIVAISSRAPVNVVLLSPDGRVLLSEKQTRHFDIETFPDGIYTIRITDAEGQLLKRGKLTKLSR